MYSHVPIPNAVGNFLCLRHNATSSDDVSNDVIPANVLSEHTHCDASQDETDSVFNDEQCTDSSLEEY